MNPNNSEERRWLCLGTNPGTTIHYHPMNGMTSHPTHYKWAFPEVMVCWNPQNWRWRNLKILVFLLVHHFPLSQLSPWYYLGRYGNPDKKCYRKQYIQKLEKDKSNVVAWCSCCWYPLDFPSTGYSFSFLGCLSSSYSSSCTSTWRPCWIC